MGGFLRHAKGNREGDGTVHARPDSDARFSSSAPRSDWPWAFPRLRQFVWFSFGAIMFGLFVWLFLLIAAGVGIVIFVDEARFDEVMEVASTVAAWIATGPAGACVVMGALAIALDKGSALLDRFRPKGR